MKTFREQMAMYQTYHTKNTTKLTHFIGVPLIIMSLISLCALVSMASTWILVVTLLCYYLLLNLSLGIIASIIFIPMTWFTQWLLLHMVAWHLFFLAIICFIVGWVLQLLGHYHEGNKPAFLDNFLQIFIAPLFLITEICFSLGFKKYLLKN
jgi:uncharacterized membrane protein YGL010W